MKRFWGKGERINYQHLGYLKRGKANHTLLFVAEAMKHAKAIDDDECIELSIVHLNVNVNYGIN